MLCGSPLSGLNPDKDGTGLDGAKHLGQLQRLSERHVGAFVAEWR
jgi:hypothetical protein